MYFIGIASLTADWGIFKKDLWLCHANCQTILENGSLAKPEFDIDTSTGQHWRQGQGPAWEASLYLCQRSRGYLVDCRAEPSATLRYWVTTAIKFPTIRLPGNVNYNFTPIVSCYGTEQKTIPVLRASIRFNLKPPHQTGRWLCLA